MRDDLSGSEAAVFALRELYLSCGYRRYKISKFEEYDLYAENRSFLSDKRILTFTDTDGRLMALKPDITLSIAKNCAAEGTDKLFYDECVYRDLGSGFAELRQTGLECIGEIDDTLTAEVASLACGSLERISDKYILDLSHVGFIGGIVDGMTGDENARAALLRAAASGGADRIAQTAAELRLDGSALAAAATLYGAPDEVLPKARKIRGCEALDGLERLCGCLKKLGLYDNLRIDFSMVSDTDYYNGVLFKGYIDGVAKSVLSGGRYDNLLARLGSRRGAIGFAVYLDELDRLFPACRPQAQTLYYSGGDDPADVLLRAGKLREKGAVLLVKGDGKNE